MKWRSRNIWLRFREPFVCNGVFWRYLVSSVGGMGGRMGGRWVWVLRFWWIHKNLIVSGSGHWGGVEVG